MKFKRFNAVALLLVLFCLLSGCSGGTTEGDISGLYEGMEHMTAKALVTADFTDYSVAFGFDYTYGGEDGVGDSLVLTAPEEICGVRVSVSGDGSKIEYDGISVEAGSPVDSGISAVLFLPELVRQWRTGVIYEQGSERLSGTDCLLVTHRTGIEAGELLYRTWFDSEELKPVCAELIFQGRRTIYCEFAEVALKYHEQS